MPRDGVGEPGAQHHKLMLLLVFRSPHRAPDGVVQPPQLALGARIHVAHARHDGVGLVVEIQAVGDQLIELDFRRSLEGASSRTPAFALLAAIAAAALLSTIVTAFAAGPVGAALVARLAGRARRAILAALLLLLGWFGARRLRRRGLLLRRFPFDCRGRFLLNFFVCHAKILCFFRRLGGGLPGRRRDWLFRRQPRPF